MTKRAFRAATTEQPSYPRLADLEAGALRRWGLVAAGGLLIGGAACTRAAGEPAGKHAATKAEKAGPSAPTPPPTAGVPWPPRVTVDAGAPDARPAQTTKAEASKSAAKAGREPSSRDRTRVITAGKPRAPRLPEPKPGK
jgi:hypothetical protein